MAVSRKALAPEHDGATSYTIETITTLADWRALAPEWDRVLRETPGGRPLQSFDFLSTWWEHLAGDRRLFIVAFFDGARLAGAAPLQIAKRSILGQTRRVVQFIGMTEDILLPTLLFPESAAPAMRRMLVEHLAAHSDDWDRIELDELAVGDPAVEALEALARGSGLLYRSYPFHDCPYLDLSAESHSSFWAKRSRKLMKNVRAGLRKLERFGTVAVETYESPRDIRRGLDAFERVEAGSWKRKARIGPSSDSRYGPFYAALLETFVHRHAARVLVLRLDEQPIAATFAIALDGVYCSLQIAHDERYAQYSPGTLLEYFELEGLLASGAYHRYEFLGGALSNKLRWTSDAIRTVCVTAARPSFAERLSDAYTFEAKPRVKQMLRLARARVAPARSAR